MFTVTESDIDPILQDYGISETSVAFQELRRYHYEKVHPGSKEVRLIGKAVLESRPPLVIRFKQEEDAPWALIEAQSRFAAFLGGRGIETPRVYSSGGHFARWYRINGYDVIVTVEDYVTGELREVDAETAEQTGMLLAQMHTIAEASDFHVPGDILFDPLKQNDLFSFEAFTAHKAALTAIDAPLYDKIVNTHTQLLQKVPVFEKEPRYAVQGDISLGNLYRTKTGDIGVFDFNRSGDAVLFFDAAMQAIYEARLMDYPAELAGKQERVILSAFLNGYHRERPFTEQQRDVFPYLYALVSAFWLHDIEWGPHSLSKALASKDAAAVRHWMQEIDHRLGSLSAMPIESA